MIGAGEPAPGEEMPTPGGSSSPASSSALTGVLGTLAGVIGTLGLMPRLERTTLRQLHNQLQNRINQVLQLVGWGMCAGHVAGI